LFNYGETKLKKPCVLVEGHYFDMFTCKFIAGDAANALKEPNSIVLTQTMAKSFFGNTDPINKVLKINNDRPVKVTALIADMPGNSTRQFDCIMAFDYSDPNLQRSMTQWHNSSWMVYVQPQSNAGIKHVEKEINDVMNKHNEDHVSTYFLFPMNKWHLYSDFKDGKNIGGPIEYVRLFSIIAVIILLIACINFMNLSTARSEKRAKEVGIRKTLGSDKKHLVFQFFSESMILVLVSFVLAIAAVYILLPSFNQLVNKHLNLDFNNPLFWLVAIGIILISGAVAGSYPALYLSSFSPVKVLKGTFAAGKSAVLPRRILIVGQFVISIFLIAATIIVYQQIQHVKNRNVGYDPNNLIMAPSTPSTDKSFAAMKNDLLRSGQVKSVVRTSSPITEIWWRSPAPDWDGKPANLQLIVNGMAADAGFAKTMGIKILAGRDFSGVPTDSTAMILNKAAVEAMHLKNPVGTLMRSGPNQALTVVGVIDNVVSASPYAPVEPLMMFYQPHNSGYINVRLNDGVQPRDAINTLRAIYTKYSPADIFEYKFIDQEFGKKFAAEELIGNLTNIFAGLAIFICCIGLAGLASFTIEKRFREIGIRKVLGATVRQLLMLIATEFLKLVAIAFVIAVPVTWWLMYHWLQKYDYRVNISIWLFGFVGAMILLLTLAVVAMNTLKAATTKPVKSLRSE